MPKIIINELDNTKAGLTFKSNFAVVVPGRCGNEEVAEDIFDENDIYECDNVNDFETNIGCVDRLVSIEIETGKVNYHYGNQIAYELLSMGYPILFVKYDPKDIISKNTLEALKDKGTYDFRYIVTGQLNNNTEINNKISALATARGDCIALVDIDEDAYLTGEKKSSSEVIKLIKAATATLSDADKYTEIFAPSVCYPQKSLTSKYKNNKFPGSFHYLACANMAARQGYAEWYAVSGFTRGLSKYTIEKTAVKLGESAVDALQPRHSIAIPEVSPATTTSETKESETKIFNKAVNIIAKIGSRYNSNYYLWGNRTAELLGDPNGADGDLRASHFANIRQLCTTIKKQAYLACKRYIYDPNSDVLWINFTSAITPILDRMKADQGIRNYRIEKVVTNRKAEFKAKIKIIPIEAVEDFEITLSLEDSFETEETSSSEDVK